MPLRRFRKYVLPLLVHLANLAWCAFFFLFGTMLAFQCVKGSNIAKLLSMRNIPLLFFVECHYTDMAYWLAGIGAALVIFTVPAFWRVRKRILGLELAISTLATVILGTAACWPVEDGSARGTFWAHWAVLGFGVAAVWFWLRTQQKGFGFETHFSPAPEPSRNPMRLAEVYLLSTCAVFVYSVLEHWKFWSPETNGGFDYLPFFRGSEQQDATLVLYSSSILFASVASLLALVVYLAFRWLRAPGKRLDVVELRRMALGGAILFALTLMIPWQYKLKPEIEAEGAVLLPMGTVVCLILGLVPLLYFTLVLLKRDTGSNRRDLKRQTYRVQRSELAFIGLFTFPIYPLMRLLRPVNWRGRWLTVMLFTAVSVVIGLTWYVNTVDFTFEDWRYMMRRGLLPCCRIFLAFAAAAGVFLVVRGTLTYIASLRRLEMQSAVTLDRRMLRWGRGVVLGTVIVCMLFATYPFWGWQHINRNVFARTYEFSSRHQFEVEFLNWLLGGTQEERIQMLVGGPRDLNPVLPPIEPVTLPQNEFRVKDPEKAAKLDGIVVIYLEGIVPRALSCYGERHLSNGAIATPSIDALAEDSVRFTHVRARYPSTWDGWYAVQTGLPVRVVEMDASKPFGDKYSRYNNLHKLLKLAGISRWCFSNVAPFVDCYIPSDEGRLDWEPDPFRKLEFPDKDQQEKDIWPGDLRRDRIVRFIDSIKPGEKFFITEHMSDTHFEWKRTSKERAQELGFPDGLEFAEEDAFLRNGAHNDMMARYYQTISRMDGQFGAIINRLRERGLYDNTLIIMIGDHGCQWYEHEHAYYPGQLYEGALRIALTIKMPGFDKGTVCDVPVLQNDIVPTVEELLGMEEVPVPGALTTGNSLVPCLNHTVTPELREANTNREVLLTTHYGTIGVLKNERYKLIFERAPGTYLLFDLQNDPNEDVNLADENPQLLKEMVECLKSNMRRQMPLLGGVTPSHPDNP